MRRDERQLASPRRPCHNRRINDRVIITKRKTCILPEEQQGQPVEEAWPSAKIPVRLQGAKIYQTEDGPVVAIPEPDGEEQQSIAARMWRNTD